MSNNEVNAAEIVPTENGNVPAENQEGEQAPQSRFQSFFAVTKSLIFRALIIYFITSFFRRSPQPTEVAKDQKATAAVPAWNLFPEGTVYDFYVYLSDSQYKFDFDDPFWVQKSLTYGDWNGGPDGDGSYTHTKKVPVSFHKKLQNNGSVYLHAFAVKSGKSPNPFSSDYAGDYVTSLPTKQVNKYKKRRYVKTKNLLTGATERTAEQIMKADKGIKEDIISHWHPNLTINIVTDQTNWVEGTVPPPLNEYIKFAKNGYHYKPVLFANEFWNLLRDYQPINETVEDFELSITLAPISLFKWQLYSAQGMRNKWASSMIGDAFVTEEDDEDQDVLKETLLETSPYLLVATVVVSLLHSVFELLAFKNDIQFWNNRKTLEGLSVRSVFFNVFQSLIVLLFVFDNDTNMIIRISCLVGLGIEIWKIHKVVNVSIDWSDKIVGLLPKVRFTDKGSYVESSTRQYDMMAFKYLSWVCFPLLAGYAVYSLIYLEHKGWYSFTLNMLYGFLLTFGFIMMTPQLFINYKLKSVAHLPWRMMTYKFLNTFIDDIFAFVIKMPTLYRLGCFRDDIVFIIFLYQRWIYKVDKKRVNEFGFSAEMETEGKNPVENSEVKAIKDNEEDNETEDDSKEKKDK